VCLARGTGLWRRTELGDSRTPPKVLPIDGDYPGGTTGIPLDGYWTMETSHGVMPYFSDAGTDFLDAGVNPVVVTSPNVLDFGYNPAGAVRPRAKLMRGTALAQRASKQQGSKDDGKQQWRKLKEQQLEGWGNSYGKGGQIYAYGKVGDAPVATRPDAACYHCLKNTQDEWQRYRACAEVCVVADCVGQCEEKNAAYNYGPTTPVHVTKMCMRQCEVCTRMRVRGWAQSGVLQPLRRLGVCARVDRLDWHAGWWHLHARHPQLRPTVISGGLRAHGKPRISGGLRAHGKPRI
jgi:hypothetical protein